MKRNRINNVIGKQAERTLSRFQVGFKTENDIRHAIQGTKANIFQENGDLFQGRERLLKLALNEAEALAWETGYPHLIFPALAQEKVAAFLSWQERQKLVSGKGERAFAA